MKYEVTDINSAQKRMVITVPSEAVDDKLNSTFKEFGKNAKLKGFRPGKAPRSIIEKMFGPQVRHHVAQELVKEYITQAVQEAGIDPIAAPLVDPGDLKKGEDFTFTAEIDVLPKLENVDMEGITIEVPSAEATTEEVEQALDNLRLGAGELKKPETPRPAVKGDYVVVDFDATSEGKAVGSQKSVGVEIGAGSMPDEFEKALIGMGEGDKKTISVTYPEGPDMPLSGKDVTFEVEVKDVMERILPDMDDEFAKDLGKDSLEDLKSHLRERLCERKEEEVKEILNREIMKELRAKNPVDLPPTMVEMQKNLLVEQTRKRFKKMNIPFDEGQFGDEFDAVAKDRVHDDILKNVIAEKNNIEVSEEELDERIAKYAEEAGHDPEKLKAALKAEDRIDQIRYHIREEKTLDFLTSSVTISCVVDGKPKPESNSSKPTSEEEKQS